MHDYPTRPRRSALFLPASNGRAIEKARTLPIDCVILDLEDAVAPDMKAAAREAAVEAVRSGGFGDRELIVRVNAHESEWGEDDLAALAGHDTASQPDAILIPKLDSPQALEHYHKRLGSTAPMLPMWAMIESAAAILALPEIAKIAAHNNLVAFVLGPNDLVKDLQCEAGEDRLPIQPHMATLVAAARAYGITAIDGVCNDFRDLDRFATEAAQGRRFGFHGKTLIHPAQVEPCNRAFSPKPEAVEEARAIVAAYALPENSTAGAIQVNGKMVERLHLDDAEKLVVLAEALEARDGG